MAVVTFIGELGAVGGVIRPFDFTIERDGAVWDLTAYSSVEWRIWDLRTKTIVVNSGALTIQTATSGIVRYTPAAADPFYANSGVFEARVWAQPATGDPEPSALHRFRIGAGPGPS